MYMYTYIYISMYLLPILSLNSITTIFIFVQVIQPLTFYGTRKKRSPNCKMIKIMCYNVLDLMESKHYFIKVWKYNTFNFLSSK